MPYASSAGTEIYYETLGRPSDPTVILITGLGGQLIDWNVEFCSMLVDRGLHVVRFDNRDSGLSTMFDNADLDLSAAINSALAGEPIEVPYTLSDMTADLLGLLDHLDVKRAHVVGVSMGGMIAQTLAVEHPERVASLTSIMSSTGSRAVGQPTPEAVAVLFERPPVDRTGAIDASVRARQIIGSPAYFDLETARTEAGAAFDRSFNPDATGRQLAAIYAAGNRTAQVAGISAPALVIHGELDTLINVSGGQHTAETIPGAQLLVFDDMGHDLPKPLWPALIDAISNHIAAAADNQ
ncbi:MAG: alpha/beta fold hydrolase [Acidimicrobiia bacterium]|nr:alpha/beta fold hydrolase [Acidimicrobiia bacterium]